MGSILAKNEGGRNRRRRNGDVPDVPDNSVANNTVTDMESLIKFVQDEFVTKKEFAEFAANITDNSVTDNDGVDDIVGDDDGVDDTVGDDVDDIVGDDVDVSVDAYDDDYYVDDDGGGGIDDIVGLDGDSYEDDGYDDYGYEPGNYDEPFTGYANADFDQFKGVDFGFDVKTGEVAGYEMNELSFNDNLVKIQVYYDSLNVEKFTESPSISFEEWISGIAGLLGLFLGFSVMTFVEYLELAVITPLVRKEKKSTNVVTPIEEPAMSVTSLRD